MCKLEKYLRNCVVSWKNVHRWQKFYMTAGHGGREKFQVWLSPPPFPLGDHLATTLSFRMCSPYPIRAPTPTNMLTPYWPFVKHLWKSKWQISSHIDHLMIVIKVFKRETDHLLLMKTIIRESVKILSALHWRPLALIRVLGLPEEQVQSRAILFCVIVFFIINKVWVGAPLRGSLHLTS